METRGAEAPGQVRGLGVEGPWKGSFEGSLRVPFTGFLKGPFKNSKRDRGLAWFWVDRV